MNEYHNLKKICLNTYWDCQGRYNYKALAMVDSHCGKDVFLIWKKHVDERKADRLIHKFRDYYEVPLHDPPYNMEKEINEFYQGKLGMFTCHDSIFKVGIV